MDTIIIGIAGGTASGKTTVAKNIYSQSLAYGTVVMIKIDDYYKRLDSLTLEERRLVNYDHPSAYDSELLINHLHDLKAKKSIQKPTYDFVAHNRSNVEEIVQPANVVIVEGIMLFAIPELRNMFNIKVFVDTPDDVRFIRRLKRDINERGRSLDSVISQYLTTVRPMHQMFVEPSKQYADLIIPEGGENVVAIDVLVTKVADILNSNRDDNHS
jgi:uridine kinase